MGNMILDSYIMILWINAVITMGSRAPFTAKDCQDLGMDKLSQALFYVRCNYSSVSQLQSLISHVETITNVLHFTHTGKKTYFWYVQWLYFAIYYHTIMEWDKCPKAIFTKALWAPNKHLPGIFFRDAPSRPQVTILVLQNKPMKCRAGFGKSLP